MPPRIFEHLPAALLDTLRKGCPALLLTVGGDHFPATAFTWVVAVDPSEVRFGVDHGTATLANLEREKVAALQIISPGNQIFLIKGDASLLKESLDAAPFKMGMWTLVVQEVKDQSWPGVVVSPLAYEWSPEQRQEMLAMEDAVFAEMVTWEG